MKGRGLFLLSFFILLMGCDEDSFNENVPTELDKKKLLALVNHYRQKGCDCGSEYYPPTETVVWNHSLENAAQIHSDDMDKNNFFSHTGSDGKEAGNRIFNAGYNWETWGENIAYGYVTEEEAITGWMNSEGHCKNIMNPNFKEMGVATSGIYWTQVFAKIKEQKHPPSSE